ncbi:hypothetical protein BHF71_01890 [Vulcanibacillus modesticaldus]|uniref:DNA-binding response regulator n=1 Tax=Vulcanibacillus modesticaldus TaxID=337097 RepID=A0A1D2YUI1_9BACI|nr:response regulator transcription factor [Vulcanibacillus modesticaldus]OEF99364.1 hypothetical protein BHF71_01890 [Vulcanibacillus modesticaldus]
MSLRLLLCDDHSLFRQGLKTLIELKSDMIIVGEAKNGLEAIEKCRILKPDFVLLDIEMPKLNGIETVKIIKNEFPDIKIIILTISEKDLNLYQALKYGADGYLLKNLEIEELVKLIYDVEAGQTVISPQIAGKVLKELSDVLTPEEKPSKYQTLTDREQEVLQLVATGISNKQIAERINISENTVKKHLRNILHKLQLKSRSEIISYAYSEGIIDENQNQ